MKSMLKQSKRQAMQINMFLKNHLELLSEPAHFTFMGSSFPQMCIIGSIAPFSKKICVLEKGTISHLTLHSIILTTAANDHLP